MSAKMNIMLQSNCFYCCSGERFFKILLSFGGFFVDFVGVTVDISVMVVIMFCLRCF